VVRNIVNGWRSECFKRLVVCTQVFWSLIALIQIHPGAAFATTALVIVDQKHNQMIVASDSLLVTNLTPNGDRFRTSQTCKIFAEPNCIFSVAGYVSDQSVNFDLNRLAIQACQEAGTLTEKANAFDKLAVKSISEYIQHIRETAPQSYEDMKQHGIANVIFLGRENAHFAICLRDFTVRKDAVSLRWTNADDAIAGLTPFVAIGTTDAIRSFRKSHKNWAGRETVSWARFFIQLEIDAHPDEVGLPISILKATPKSGEPDELETKWIDTGACLPNYQH